MADITLKLSAKDIYEKNLNVPRSEDLSQKTWTVFWMMSLKIIRRWQI